MVYLVYMYHSLSLKTTITAGKTYRSHGWYGYLIVQGHNSSGCHGWGSKRDLLDSLVSKWRDLPGVGVHVGNRVVFERHVPRCFMYGIFTYICHTFMINLGKYTWILWGIYPLKNHGLYKKVFFKLRLQWWQIWVLSIPGDSKCLFHPLVGGHLTPWKGHLTIPKRSHWITRYVFRGYFFLQKTVNNNRLKPRCVFICHKFGVTVWNPSNSWKLRGMVGYISVYFGCNAAPAGFLPVVERKRHSEIHRRCAAKRTWNEGTKDQ